MTPKPIPLKGVSLRVNPFLLDKIDQIAAAANWTRSLTINRAIEIALKDEEFSSVLKHEETARAEAEQAARDATEAAFKAAADAKARKMKRFRDCKAGGDEAWLVHKDMEPAIGKAPFDLMMVAPGSSWPAEMAAQLRAGVMPWEAEWVGPKPTITTDDHICRKLGLEPGADYTVLLQRLKELQDQGHDPLAV